MKKYFVIVAMALAMCMPATAATNEAANVESVEMYQFNINKEKLYDYLKVNKDQVEISNTIMHEFENDMKFAAQMGTVEQRNAILNNLMKKNLTYMRYVLDKDQFHRYLRVLNATLNNRGFDIAKMANQ